MTFKFYFQQNEVSFFFFLSHLSALSCIRSADDAIYIGAVHQVFQDTELLLGGGGHEVLPLLRQDGQVSDVPLNELFIVDIGWRKLYQMPNAPTNQIAIALQITVLAASCTKDFCIGHSDRWFFCYNKLIRQ